MDTMNQNDRETLIRMEQSMNEEANVEELEYTPNMDEQSAAWREVVREAVRGLTGLGWGYLFYLTAKMLIDLFLAFVP
mgnify:FL=1